MDEKSSSSSGAPDQVNPAAKPVADVYRPEITCLPELTRRRSLFRRFLRSLARMIAFVATRVQVKGYENIPDKGPYLMVYNHLGDADAVVGLAYIPVQVDVMAKMELYDFPILGNIMEAYGVIWVHRGLPDRRALRAVFQGLSEGRVIGLAPEARESITGELEEGTGGAAFLALKAKVNLLPVTFTGTENKRVYSNLKRLRRTDVSLTFGPLFQLESLPDRREAVAQGTQKIMQILAMQLPMEYRGIYRDVVE